MRKNYDYDWFNRSRENDYTFYDSSKRLFDWDSGLDSFSSYFRAKNPASDAGKLLGSMFSVIGVDMKNHKFLGTAQAVKTTLEAGGVKAKGVVQIPINMLRDDKGNYVEDPKIIDAFYGASIQNAAMAAMQSSSEYRDSITVRTLKSPEITNTEAYVTSLLNTERIDKKLGNDFPGYLKFVQKYKNHAYAKASESDVLAEMMKDRGAKLLDLVTKMLRYPADVTEAELTEFAEPIEKIREYMQRNGGIPTTYRGCKTMGAGLTKLLYEIEPPPPSDGGGSDDKDGESGENDGDGGGSGSGKAPSGKSKKGESPMDAAAREMMKEIVNADMAECDMNGDAVKDMAEFDKSTVETDGYAEEGEAFKSKIEYRSVTGNKEAYLNVRSKIDMSKAQTIARLFARKNKDYKFSLKSMRSGRLDTEKLAEAVQGVSTIYERMGEVKTNKICVGVLIDESGSMGGSKMQKAREAAVFINEIFKKIGNVELFIYGHTADENENDTTQIYIYREPGKATDMYALGSCRARIENRDGDAILAAGMRMRKLTQNAGILFVISDGEPCASHYHGTSSIEDTKQKVLMTEKLGLQVIQIAIESSVRSERMFKHFIKMTDIANLPNEMVKFLSKKIDHLIKEKVFV